MFKIGDKLTKDNYTQGAFWCNENNATINEDWVIIEIPQPSEEEIAQAKIAELKAKLSETDYIVIKIAEGEATKEEYADILANRKAWRAEINELEE